MPPTSATPDADIVSLSGNAGQQEPAAAAPDELGGSCLRLLHQLAAAGPAAEAMARTLPPAVPVLVAAMGWGVAGERRASCLRLHHVSVADCSRTAAVSCWAASGNCSVMEQLSLQEQKQAHLLLCLPLPASGSTAVHLLCGGHCQTRATGWSTLQGIVIPASCRHCSCTGDAQAVTVLSGSAWDGAGLCSQSAPRLSRASSCNCLCN